MTVDLKEEFDDGLGRFLNYDAYNTGQAAQLRQQKHVDIRSFVPVDLGHTLSMFELDQLTMAGLDADTVQALEGLAASTRINEAWTSGTVTTQADRNHFYGISLACVAGANSTQSVLVNNLVDISGLANTDAISLALPAFPLASITTASSFLDLTSSATGDFVGGPTDSIAFSSSTTTLTNAADCEFRFPISLLTHINKAAITGVRLRIQATGNCTFRCLAIRALSATWDFAPMDANTLYGRLTRTVPRDSSSSSYNFPSATWPIVFKATDPPSTADPRPIDQKTSLVFNTGSKTNASTSSVALYFRELGLDENTQLDLTGTYTQADLDNYGTSLITTGGTTVWTPGTLPGQKVQPDFGRALYDPRTQSVIDAITQADLDSDTQFSLERVQDTVSAAYIEAKLSWTNAVASLTIFNANATGYTFSGITLAANTDYGLFVDLHNTLIRVKLYQLDVQGYLGTLIYDTGGIDDATLIHRRKGRIGWYTSLLDGDAYVNAIRPRGANFSEYISLPLYSDTPVSGARLNTHGSPDQELLTSLAPSQWGGMAVFDNSKSNDFGHDGLPGNSAAAYKIVTDGTQTLQGVQTNAIYFENFADTEIEFDLLFPSISANSGANIFPFLYSVEQGRVIVLPSPILDPDQWTHVTLSLAPYTDLFQTGLYRLLIVQPQAISATWYLDNLSCHTRVITWDGRSAPNDAWGMADAGWLPFLDAVNNSDDGIVFPTRGRGLQVRARATQQTGEIEDIAVQPKYADLGRLVWTDQRPAFKPGLLPAIGVVNFVRTPSFEYGAFGTGDVSMGFNGGGANTFMARVTSSGLDGVDSLGAEMVSAGVGAPTGVFGIAPQGNGCIIAESGSPANIMKITSLGTAISQIATVTPGQTLWATSGYNIQTGFGPNSGNPLTTPSQLDLNVYWYDVNGAILSHTNAFSSTSLGTTGSWHRVSGAVTVPASAVYAALQVVVTQPLSVTSYLLFDSFGLMSPGISNPFYFDGDYTGDLVGANWMGTAGQSFSTYGLKINGLRLTITGRFSTTSGDPLIAYIWSFGDGTYDFGPTPSHTYANHGTYTVTLMVVDSKGQRIGATTTVTV